MSNASMLDQQRLPAAHWPGVRRPGDRTGASVIGSDLTIVGNVVSRGEVQLDGVIQGDIRGVNIVVGEKSTITGGVIANEVVVRGRVQGSIRGNSVMLQASSHVEGDVFHQRLSIEQGCYFEGKSRRMDDPTAEVATAAGPDQAPATPVAA